MTDNQSIVKAKTNEGLHLKKIDVDSLKVRYFAEQVRILDPNLGAKYININNETGEVVSDEFDNNRIEKYGHGIKVSFCMAKMVNFDNSVTDYVVLLINSKSLESRYFEGITIENVINLYHWVMSWRVVEMDFQTFLSGMVTDCDFKFDDREPLDQFKGLVKWCLSNTHKTNRSVGARPFRQKNNRGVQWSDRKSTKFKTAPYLKIYHKEIELDNKSFDFAKKWLDEIDYTDVFRLEYTIKNKKHFKYALGMADFDPSLINVITLTQNQKYAMLQKVVKAHINPEPLTRGQKTTTPNKVMLSNAITWIVNNSTIGNTQLEQLLTAGLDSKNIGRHRAFLDEILYELYQDKDFKLRIEDNQYSYNWFQQFMINPLEEDRKRLDEEERLRTKKVVEMISKGAEWSFRECPDWYLKEKSKISLRNPSHDDGVFSSKMRKKQFDPNLQFGSKEVQRKNSKKGDKKWKVNYYSEESQKEAISKSKKYGKKS